MNLNPLIIVIHYWINGMLNHFECSSSLLINNNDICNMISTTINGSTKTKTITKEYDQMENLLLRRKTHYSWFVLSELCDIMNNLFTCPLYIYELGKIKCILSSLLLDNVIMQKNEANFDLFLFIKKQVTYFEKAF